MSTSFPETAEVLPNSRLLGPLESSQPEIPLRGVSETY